MTFVFKKIYDPGSEDFIIGLKLTETLLSMKITLKLVSIQKRIFYYFNLVIVLAHQNSNGC